MPWRGERFEPTKEQRDAWRCGHCGSRRWVGFGMWPNSGPVKGQCVPCGAVTDWPEPHER